MINLYSILTNAAISVEKVDKFVVVKTLTGAASAAAEAIDSLIFRRYCRNNSW